MLGSVRLAPGGLSLDQGRLSVSERGFIGDSSSGKKVGERAVGAQSHLNSGSVKACRPDWLHLLAFRSSQLCGVGGGYRVRKPERRREAVPRSGDLLEIVERLCAAEAEGLEPLTLDSQRCRELGVEIAWRAAREPNGAIWGWVIWCRCESVKRWAVVA